MLDVLDELTWVQFFFFAKSPLSHLTDRADLMEAVYAPAVPKPAHGGGV